MRLRGILLANVRKRTGYRENAPNGLEYPAIARNAPLRRRMCVTVRANAGFPRTASPNARNCEIVPGEEDTWPDALGPDVALAYFREQLPPSVFRRLSTN